jgi:hypothetical protein
MQGQVDVAHLTSRARVDAIWQAVMQALGRGDLNHAAEVSVKNGPSQVVIECTCDVVNVTDRGRVAAALAAAVHSLSSGPLSYKPDISIELDIYDKNVHGIKPTIDLHRLQTLAAQTPRQG